MTTNLPGDTLRDVNEKLLIASVQQQELAEIAIQAQQRLAAMVDGLNAVICEVSIPTGGIRFLSKHAETILGYDRDRCDVRGFWRRIIHPDDRAATVARIFRAIRSRQDQEDEFRIITADGRIIWIRNRAVVVVGADGAAVLMRCVIEDVSKRKEAEAIFARSERRYRRLFEAARDGVLLLDSRSGLITDANPFAAELLGFAHEAMLGKDFFEVGLLASNQASIAAFTRLQAEHTVRYESLPLNSPDGISRTVELIGNVYRENGHDVIQCHIRDVTDIRRAETLQAEALEREQRITEFLQRPLLANFSEDAFPGLALAALYEPAMQEAEVGGDFFDAFSVGNTEESRRIVLCVGDVMGKGLKAASLAARLKEVIHAFMGEDADPARTLFRLNHYLCDTVQGNDPYGSEKSFDFLLLSALSIAVVEPETCTVTISTAGAEPVSILRAAGGDAEIVAAPGVTLGVTHDEPYINAQITLHPGDTLVMTTDGLTEARKGKEFLNYEGLMEIARRNLSAPTVSEMGQAIVRDARAFGGSFNDDICLLLARCG